MFLLSLVCILHSLLFLHLNNYGLFIHVGALRSVKCSPWAVGTWGEGFLHQAIIMAYKIAFQIFKRCRQWWCFESSDFWRVVALFFPYGKDCWHPFHYRIAESLILVPNIDQMSKEMKKIQTGNRSLINLFQLNAYQKASISQQSSVYCWSRKQTRKRRRISGFCRSNFFFLHKKY